MTPTIGSVGFSSAAMEQAAINSSSVHLIGTVMMSVAA